MAGMAFSTQKRATISLARIMNSDTSTWLGMSCSSRRTSMWRSPFSSAWTWISTLGKGMKRAPPCRRSLLRRVARSKSVVRSSRVPEVSHSSTWSYVSFSRTRMMDSMICEPTRVPASSSSASMERGGSVDSGGQGAGLGAQDGRQHRNLEVGKVHGRAPVEGLPIEEATRDDELGGVGDVDAHRATRPRSSPGSSRRRSRRCARRRWSRCGGA